jgi:hypothetical protein
MIVMNLSNSILSNAKKQTDYAAYIKNEKEETFFEKKLNEFAVDIEELIKDQKTVEKNVEKWLKEIPPKDKADLDEELKNQLLKLVPN